MRHIPNTFVLCEYPDVGTLEKIWRNEMIIPQDQIRLCNYRKEVCEGRVHVTYERKAYNNNYYGRYFPRDGRYSGPFTSGAPSKLPCLGRVT